MGFDIDLCRAVAAAVLGDADAVEYRPTTAAERGPTMQSGEVDMMSRNTTWTSSRNITWGNFAPLCSTTARALWCLPIWKFPV